MGYIDSAIRTAERRDNAPGLSLAGFAAMEDSDQAQVLSGLGFLPGADPKVMPPVGTIQRRWDVQKKKWQVQQVQNLKGKLKWAHIRFEDLAPGETAPEPLSKQTPARMLQVIQRQRDQAASRVIAPIAVRESNKKPGTALPDQMPGAQFGITAPQIQKGLAPTTFKFSEYKAALSQGVLPTYGTPQYAPTAPAQPPPVYVAPAATPPVLQAPVSVVPDVTQPLVPMEPEPVYDVTPWTPPADDGKYGDWGYIPQSTNDWIGDEPVFHVTPEIEPYPAWMSEPYDFGGDFDTSYGMGSWLSKAAGVVTKIAAPVASLIPGVGTLVGGVASLASAAFGGGSQGQQAAAAYNQLAPGATNQGTFDQLLQVIQAVRGIVAEDKTAKTAQAAAAGQTLPPGVFRGPDGKLYRAVTPGTQPPGTRVVQGGSSSSLPILIGAGALLLLARR